MNRTQITQVENYFSNCSIIKYGVGYHNDLIIFVLYINDIPSTFSTKIHIELFADDTNIYFYYTFESEISLLQNNLNLFSHK